MQDDRVESALGYALVRAFRRVNRACNRALARCEVTAEQAHILLLLWTAEAPMKIGDLQRSLVLSSGTLTGAIDRMEKAGLVRRTPDPDDGRAWRVEASIPAKRRRAIEDTLEKTENETFAALDAREKKELFRLLGKIAGEPAT